MSYELFEMCCVKSHGIVDYLPSIPAKQLAQIWSRHVKKEMQLI